MSDDTTGKRSSECEDLEAVHVDSGKLLDRGDAIELG